MYKWFVINIASHSYNVCGICIHGNPVLMYQHCMVYFISEGYQSVRLTLLISKC